MKNIFYAWGWIVAFLGLFTAVNSRATGYTLTVSAQGSGTVLRNPSNSSYPSGVTVAITATPGAGWYFANWSGDTNGSVNPLNVVMNSSLNITGNFLPYPVYNLTLTTNGQGTIALSPAGTSFFSNTLVTATATPAAGWVFTGWTGSAAGTTNPLAFTMNSANSLTGNFAQLPALDVPPVGVTNRPGSTVSFFAHAVGTAPLAYQWYFNNAPLAGATNTTLAYTNVSLSQAGSYQITATNNYGSTTSSVVLLVLTNGASNPVSVCDEPNLRAAIAKGGWISFGCNGTITLANTITISNTVTLDASGVNATISGGSAVRLFNVTSAGSLIITNLTLANGMFANSGSGTTPADGGAIYNNGGTVTLVACTLTNNAVTNVFGGTFAHGGAIFNNGGVVTLIGTSVSNNLAITGSTGTANGGAIYTTNGSLTATGCTLSGNTCNSYQTNAAAGGAVCIVSGTAYFTNCIFNANGALGAVTGSILTQIPGAGGAIAVLGGGMIVNQCQFLNNTAQGGTATGYTGISQGGAIYCTATANIASSSFLYNSVPSGLSKNTQNNLGGAIYNSGVMQLNGCCICSNFVQGSSGVNAMIGTSDPGNGLGAGVFNAGQLWATNCTFALNTAQSGFGYALRANGAAMGAGLCNNSNATTVCMNVTLASNLCSAFGVSYYGYSTNGFTVGDQVANLGGTLRLHNTLLAYASTNGNAYGVITDDGYNISSDGSAAFASGSSYNLTDPKLGPLADNGGPTLTMAPLPISPAIDFGDANGAPHSDQRGLLRPYGDGYDIGAVEYGSTYPAPSPANLLFTRSAKNLLLNFSATPTIVYHLQSSTNLTSWVDEETIGAFTSPSNISRTITPQGNTKKFYRVWYQ
ncbi:MAG: choice-of-anchor Q domain-containing protein [Verrucomicrobiae bacterium]|nr:choice-of-anchor Q domain-containing protein [Verrucomicrobiae bacterium]